MKYLFVVAHPDDELLACGASISKLIRTGNEVYVCVMNSVSDIRCGNSQKMMNEMGITHKMLGVSGSFVGDFETMHFNVIPQIELVEFIEKAIIQCKPDVVITHYHSDLHSDHRETSIACTTAVRLYQRQINNVSPIKKFAYMEVPSSTDWSNNFMSCAFVPNMYIGVEHEDINKKILALKTYTEGGVLRDVPHPRSPMGLTAKAIERGLEIGYSYAEAYMVVFERE